MSVQEQSLNALATDHLQADLKGRSVRGGLTTLSSQATQFVIQSVATVVLARLLTPADFGLVAMVTAITGLASAFADLGLSEATIQRKSITQDQVSVLFWINVAIGLGLTLITAAAAPVLVRFYREPRLLLVTLVVSLTFFIGGLRVQPDALLKRQMRFSALAVRDIASATLGVAVAIIMAWRGASYWALVALPLTMNLTQMGLSWLMANWKPNLPQRGTNVRTMIAFGGKVAASYLIVNLNRSTDNVLIGWYCGAVPLGFYSRAYNLLMLPVRQISLPAAAVAVPTFSRLQGDPERFARYYLRAISLVMWISAPIFAFLFVAATPVILLTLGAQWRESAPVFRILAISALGQLLLESTIWIFVSRGLSDRLLKLLLVISPIIIASFMLGLPFGIKGVALSGSVVLLAVLPWILRFAFRGTDLTLGRLGRVLLCPGLLCIAGALVAQAALSAFAPRHIVSQLMVVAAGFMAAYALSFFIPAVREEMMSLRTLWSELQGSRRAAETAV